MVRQTPQQSKRFGAIHGKGAVVALSEPGAILKKVPGAFLALTRP
jgi:hypothetical protein